MKSLGLFGSYVRGEETECRDLDLLVEFAETPDLLEFVAMGRDAREQNGARIQGTIAPQEVVTIVVTVE